ncbi:MAG: TPM domain-containing protein [Bdellovibrionaceae bacterium]|nr:TPM domain-containing protein [Pseudobdellovibrionaceae bacterium]
MAAAVGPVVVADLAVEELQVTGEGLRTENCWIKKYLTEDEVRRLSEVVRRAEQRTSGEIVPVIVDRSTGIGHVSLMLTLFSSLAFFLLEIPIQTYFFSPLWLSLSPLMVFVFWGISLILARKPFWQRILTHPREQSQQVWNRAELEFSRNKIGRTSEGTGILIFVSVMERKAVILADTGISKHYHPEVWQSLVKEFSASLKAGRWYQGFEKAILEAGKILEEKLPIESHDTNELQNSLRIISS